MQNEIKVLNKAERMNGVKALESAGFPAIRSGLGVPNGKYLFTTPNSEQIYATKAISTAKGNFGLTMIAGVLKGKDAESQEVNIRYGLTTIDKQFVVTYDHFMLVEPNQAYDVEVLNGRVKTLSLVQADVIDTSEVIQTKKKKAALEL
ncbi:MAG: hypothetical protein H7Y13_03725 [Sphingobacteriaceae bacterium]|nr:hypothetical protein [Sphingobacteriaceae bacterium]